jgi:pentafunctional AROM polypeptide
VKGSTSIAIITDQNVWKMHGHRLLHSLRQRGILNPPVKILPPGEASKSREMKAEIEDWLISIKFFRSSILIAYGGGVVGDLTGFVASTFMRGISFVQIPTTLLAMVDSAIGGKTGIDIPSGKNLIGSFHQPEGVFIDPSFLKTLSTREFSNGMAEIIKAGAINDPILFNLCENEAEKILGNEIDGFSILDSTTNMIVEYMEDASDSIHVHGNDDNLIRKPFVMRKMNEPLLLEVISRACNVKVQIVNADEKEGSKRAILNFGHTVGHGIEAVMQPTLLHGECVAIGMVKEAEISRALGHCSSSDVGRIKRICKAYNLPTNLPSIMESTQGLDQVFDHIFVDKKNERDQKSSTILLKLILLTSVGNVLGPPFTHSVEASLIRRILSTRVIVNPYLPGLSPSPSTHFSVRAPGSKSISNRVLLLAGLSSGKTRIKGLLASDDTTVMISALQALGATISWNGSTGVADIDGIGGNFAIPSKSAIYVQNAGTASRFLTSILTLIPFQTGTKVILEGNARMNVRPIGPLVSALRDQGAEIRYLGKENCLPLEFSRGLSEESDTHIEKNRIIHLEAKVSSQYVSSILMAAPFFSSPTGFIELILAEEHPTSLPYILMTISTMADFGVVVQQISENHFIIPRKNYSAYNGEIYEIEADASSASYAAAVAAITGFSVTLEGVGSSSTQGDAGFPRLLGLMGATVSQTVTETTITGPSVSQKYLSTEPISVSDSYLKGIEVNMENQTDCFMTLAVVAALAEGITKITGIANQRVKECNRIAAMVNEFQKIGVEAKELPGGIQIEGTGFLGSRFQSDKFKSPFKPATIHCYDDHRIAMSFGVLSTIIPGITIDDAACIEKTYPEFWDVLEQTFKLKVNGASIINSKLAPQLNSSKFPIILVGMRGVGKSTLGSFAASDLSLPTSFIDIDKEIEKEFNSTISSVIENIGWEKFRSKEASILSILIQSAIKQNDDKGVIISTGGGIVESEEARLSLKNFMSEGGHVIEIQRDIDDILQDLKLNDPTRPAYANGETIHDVYLRRKMWYRQCSSSTFSISHGNRMIDVSKSLFTRRLKILAEKDLEPPGFSPSSDDGTSFVCVAVTDIRALIDDHDRSTSFPSDAIMLKLASFFREVIAATDLVEFRVDCLDDISEDNIKFQTDILRSALQLSVSVGNISFSPPPVLYTVRSLQEGGKFTGNEELYSSLVSLGIRLGYEAVDIESGRNRWSSGMALHLARFARSKNVQIVGSAHWPRSPIPSVSEISSAISACSILNQANIIKLVACAQTALKAMQFSLSCNELLIDGKYKSKSIVLSMGEVGKFTRVINNTLTPVTHKMLTAAAPGQLTLPILRELRNSLGLVSPRKYFLVGSPISQSRSPPLQNATFSHGSFHHTYSLFETEVAQEAVSKFRSDSCGGGNVTIPLKRDIVSSMDRLSLAAGALKSVNTVVNRNGKLFGDNTDWLGVYFPLKRRLANKNTSMLSALVIGAGGTSPSAIFALKKLGFTEIYIINRTIQHAEVLAEAMGVSFLPSVDSILSTIRNPIGAIICTLPGQVQWTCPEEVLRRFKELVVFDVVYSSEGTKLQQQAISITGNSCSIIGGLEMLHTQGLAAQAIWLGKVTDSEVIFKLGGIPSSVLSDYVV